MRRIMLSLVAFGGLGSAAFAQTVDLPTGVHPPTGPAWPTPKAANAKTAKPMLQEMDLGRMDGGPIVTVPGTVAQGTMLPNEVRPTPIPDRPGYGQAVVNGHRAIIDMNTHTVFQYSK